MGRLRERAMLGRGRRALHRPLFRLRRLVDDDALERPCAPLVEVEPAGQRLDAHLEVLDLDAQPRRFDDEVVNQLVIQLIDPRACFASCFALDVIVFSRDWMCSAWMSGFGLKNSLRIGCSSLRIQRSGARCDSNSVSSSNA